MLTNSLKYTKPSIETEESDEGSSDEENGAIGFDKILTN